MRSGLSANAGPFNRVTVIICPSLDFRLGVDATWASRAYRHPARAGEEFALLTGVTRRGHFGGCRLLLEVHQVLQDLVGGRDDPGVGLEPALGDDQVRE